MLLNITCLSSKDNNLCKLIFNKSVSENMNENLNDISLCKGILLSYKGG